MSDLGGFGSGGNDDDGYFFPQRDNEQPVRSKVSFHEAEDKDARSRLAPEVWLSLYCFTDYIEAIPLTGEIAGSSLDDGELDEFPEFPAASRYATFYALDCIAEAHAREIATTNPFKYLDPDHLLNADVTERKALLNDLLDRAHMFTIYIMTGPENDKFFDIFQRFNRNDWEKIEIRPPTDGTEDLSIHDVIGTNLANDCLTAHIAANPTTGTAKPVFFRLPDESISDAERRWLTEIVSFNHIPDIGNSGPTDDGTVPTPPVPIFPLDLLGAHLEPLEEWEQEQRIKHRTDPDEVLEEYFEKNEFGHWVHKGTGYFTIEYGNCWVDGDGNGYRLYADPDNPSTIVFVYLDTLTDIPPQSPNYRIGIHLTESERNIGVWHQDAYSTAIAVGVG